MASTQTSSVGHGLGKAPEVVIFKKTSNTNDWVIQMREANYNKQGQFLGNWFVDWSSAAPDSNPAYWGTNLADDNVVHFGNPSGSTNNEIDNGEFIAYCWTSIPGYSKFGSYMGRGSQGPATTVYTGFKPRLVLVKAGMGTSWQIMDTERGTQNRWDPDANAADVYTTKPAIEILPNGFQVLRTDNVLNATILRFITWRSLRTP